MNKKQAKQLLLSKDIEAIKKFIGNKFFSVEFYKKDGTLRKMQCRLNVKKHLKGGTKSYDSDALEYLTVYSIDSKGYRTVNLNTIKQIKANRKVITL